MNALKARFGKAKNPENAVEEKTEEFSVTSTPTGRPLTLEICSDGIIIHEEHIEPKKITFYELDSCFDQISSKIYFTKIGGTAEPLHFYCANHEQIKIKKSFDSAKNRFVKRTGSALSANSSPQSQTANKDSMEAVRAGSVRPGHVNLHVNVELPAFLKR